ncbi:MAG: HEAT repeat domain-containing protein [Candidatus Aenigmarchaeota archaeon]|nr:HEAT repeat domain-containing protein [Candidatus Aenigmarchaeota archaeon]
MSCISNTKYSMINNLSDPRFVLPGTKPNYAPDKEFKTEHIKMSFSFDFNKNTLFGSSETSLRAIKDSLSFLKFDAVDMKIYSVKINGKKSKYNYDGNILKINVSKMKVGTHCIVKIDYKLVDPKLGVFFIKRKDIQVWTHSEAEEARHWYPCYDSPNEKCTTEMILTVPKDYTGVSNGKLIEIRDSGKNKIFHWKMNYPHSTYLVSFAIGKFSLVKDSWNGVSVEYYCEKGREDDIKRAFGKTPKMLEFFSKKIGVKYPYEKYAQVAVWDFVYGGMEHTTCTTQMDCVLFDKRGEKEGPYLSESLAAHELAHQWFGDLVTCKHWSHAWLNESFATYFDALFAEHDLGYEEFNYEMYRNLASYLDEDTQKYRRSIVTNLFKHPSDIFDRHLYQKGSWILHMLRWELGDELWWKVINHYVKKFSHKSVETLDLINCIEEVTGKNMRKFFDQWIFKAGHPDIRVIFSFDEKKKLLSMRISQEQRPNDETSFFSFPLEIEVVTKSGKKLYTENIEVKQHLFKYKLSSAPLMIRVDPEWKILKKMDFPRSVDMLIYQLKNDKNPLGRVDVVNELGKNSSIKAQEALSSHLLKEKFWAVQAHIARNLALIRSDYAYNALLKGLSIKNTFAKRTVIEALGEFKNKKTLEILKREVTSKDGYLVASESLRSLGKLRYQESLSLLKKYSNQQSWSDTIQLGVADGLFFLNNEQSLSVLKTMTTRKYPQRIRMAAIRNIGKLGKCRKDILEMLIKLSEDRDILVQISVAQSLGDMLDERAVPILEKMTKGHVDGRVKRIAEDSIRKIQTWTDDIEISRLQKENEELKKQLGKKSPRLRVSDEQGIPD